MKTKPPANFLTLACELRQYILCHTFTPTSCPALERWDDGPEWHKRIDKAAIEEWTQVLKRVAKKPEIVEDVEYAKRQWLEEADDSAIHDTKPWNDLSLSDRKAIWQFTGCEGEEPWLLIHRKLYILNKKWLHHLGRQISWEMVINRRNCPPSDQLAVERHLLKQHATQSEVDQWQGTPSGIVWDRSGRTHHPSTWENLRAAVNGDVLWLRE